MAALTSADAIRILRETPPPDVAPMSPELAHELNRFRRLWRHVTTWKVSLETERRTSCLDPDNLRGASTFLAGHGRELRGQIAGARVRRILRVARVVTVENQGRTTRVECVCAGHPVDSTHTSGGQ